MSCADSSQATGLGLSQNVELAQHLPHLLAIALRTGLDAERLEGEPACKILGSRAEGFRLSHTTEITQDKIVIAAVDAKTFCYQVMDSLEKPGARRCNNEACRFPVVPCRRTFLKYSFDAKLRQSRFD